MPISANLGPRWSAETARAWYEAQPWILGCNFLPSSAVNFVDMWHPETFAAETIDRELAWAAEIGMNAVRINLQYMLWRMPGGAHQRNFETFLGLAAKHSIKTAPCFFDDCAFGGLPANTRRQPDPVPGVHNSRALASPGREIVMDRSQWPDLLEYVAEVVKRYASDERILFWDLYNEPGNLSIFQSDVREACHDPALKRYSKELCLRSFDVAFEVDPEHPVSAGAWSTWSDAASVLAKDPYQDEIDQAVLAISDVVTFHAYLPRPAFERAVNYLQRFERPLICTEWMARTAGSRIQDKLPYMHANRIGAFQWGLVRGRTQTYIPWPNLKANVPDYDESKTEWFHDILQADGTPYDCAETDMMRHLARRQI